MPKRNTNTSEMENERKEYTLSELNGKIRDVVSEAFPSSYWVRAEMSDVRTNASSGHC